MTDDEIQALWDEACKDSPQNPGWNRHIRFARALLSKLRAPVADELVASLRRMASVAPASECEVLHAAANALASAPATNQATSEGQNMFYEGLFEGETERQRDRRLKWMKTMRPASAPVAFYRQSLRDLLDVVWKEATESTAVPDTAWADRLIDKVFPSVLASAPVADERQGDIAAGLQDSAYCAGLQRGFMLGNHNDNDGLRQALESRDGYVKTIKDARDALASAPVAGEAGELLRALVNLHAVARVDRDEDYAAVSNAAEIIARHAAPQASEAGRDAGIAASGDVALPPLPEDLNTFQRVIYICDGRPQPRLDEVMHEYGRAAVVANRWRFDARVFHGPAPEGFENWFQWSAAPVKKGAFIRAATADDWKRSDDAPQALLPLVATREMRKAADGISGLYGCDAGEVWEAMVAAALSAQPGAQKEQSDE